MSAPMDLEAWQQSSIVVTIYGGYCQSKDIVSDKTLYAEYPDAVAFDCATYLSTLHHKRLRTVSIGHQYTSSNGLGKPYIHQYAI